MNEIQNRIDRALSQKMYLVHAVRNGPTDWNFTMQGNSGVNYDIELTNEYMSCTCPDFSIRHRACKHLFFIVGRVARDMESLRTISEHVNIFSVNPDIDKVFQSRIFDRNKRKRRKGDEDENWCVICFGDKGSRNISVCVKCGKSFHDKCIRRWVRKNKSCPMCRGEWDDFQLP